MRGGGREIGEERERRRGGGKGEKTETLSESIQCIHVCIHIINI